MRILLLGERDSWASPLLAALGERGFELLDEAADPPSCDAVLTLARGNWPSATVRVGDLAIDLVARRVSRGGVPIRLSMIEFALLAHLARHRGTVVGRHALLETVWGYRFDPGTNLVAVHISRLRAKLNRAAGPPVIHSVPGGYRIGDMPAGPVIAPA
jgi:two-component system OmpR family response regulator